MLLVIIYLAFIGLGLPDSLLGSAWPQMSLDLEAQTSAAGLLTMTICACTIISSLVCDWLLRRLGTSRLTAISVAVTAVGVLGFSRATSLWQLMAIAVPYGLGAGAVDAALNAYAAVHLKPIHVNWLHCSWGIGASVGPVIMAWRLGMGESWRGGYAAVGLILLALSAFLMATLRFWPDDAGKGLRSQPEPASSPASEKPLPTRSEALRLPGVLPAFAAFFLYCALESSAGVWSSTFMVQARGIPADTATFLVSLFYLGITAGRFLSGVLTLRLSGQQLLRLGVIVVVAGAALLAFVPSQGICALGLALLGIGCAPIYPQIIQLTPQRFGESASQVLMGPQLACAYVGSLTFPPVMGLVLQHVAAGAYPWVLGVLVVGLATTLAATDRAVSES